MRSLVLIVLLLPFALHAQTPGQCELGTAEAILDVGEVRAALFNTGSLFFGNEVDDGSGYLVPKMEGTSPLFAAGLWVGGKVDGEVRTAAARYHNFEFWPGPLEAGATLPSPADCSAYDRIFVVSRDDVARYLATGEATADLRDWPAELGAPVLDGDGIPGNYDLDAGDQPAVWGEQAAWWVMNDVGNEHAETESAPLGLEVQVTAFAADGGLVPLRQATFYRYRIANRNTQPIDSAYVSFFTDAELGNAQDNYIGSDTLRAMGFVYNADNDDQGGLGGGYGTRPAALGVRVVQGPVGLPNGRDDDGDGGADETGERFGMTALSCYTKTSIGEPNENLEFYRCMRGTWTEGTPITEGGGGYQTGGEVTKFVFPGDPTASDPAARFWSEPCVNVGCGAAYPLGNRRFMLSSGPFRLEPGEVTEVVYALPFARGTSALDAVVQLRTAADVVQNAWNTGALAPTRVEAAVAPPEAPGAVELERPRPNPFTDRLTLRYTLPDVMTARITLLDVLGREVATLASGSQSAGPHEAVLDAEALPAGLYLVRFEAGTEARTFPVVKAR